MIDAVERYRQLCRYVLSIKCRILSLVGPQRRLTQAAFTSHSAPQHNETQKNARRRCALFWVSWTYANVCKICAKWLTIVIRVNWLLLLLHRYASDGRMLTAEITFIYTSYYTSHLSHNMQIWPRARWSISYWFFGRATCCDILRYIAAKTTQHATHAAHAFTPSGVNPVWTQFLSLMRSRVGNQEINRCHSCVSETFS